MDEIKVPGNNFNRKSPKYTYDMNKSTSLSTLVVWNISKVLGERPSLNLKEAVKAAQLRLEEISNAGDIQSIFTESPYERHLACALLAWQQLGHSDTDSLCRFIEERTHKDLPTKLSSKRESSDSVPRSSKSHRLSSGKASPELPEVRSQDSEVSTRYEDATGSPSISSYAMGPVVRLPVETKIVMRLDAPPKICCPSGPPGKKKPSDKDIKGKIDQACCMDTECAERLNALDKTTNDLRQRITKLAWREAERVELLERAEAAWKDLEVGYQRRLALAEEKEEDIAKQIAKMLDERNTYRDACTTLGAEVKNRAAAMEKERTRLNDIDKIVCERACQRMKLSEESSKLDALVAENATKSAQLDRDLMFKEDQARRNSENLQNEVRSMKVMTSEAERSTRAELRSLRDQITDVSNKLLKEDEINSQLKAEINELCTEKTEIIEDLEGCKAQCDNDMQARMEVMNKKREALCKLREKVMECRCQLPVNKAVEVKRTPSLAALCKCTPEDKILDSCSCTSMRTKMLSNLFADLFSGLQSEMQGSVTQMPCQLLKCLEDRHNWDRASVLKTNLKDYFSSLLSGELDIAIATSIENYHAKWVGISCADKIKMKPGPGDDVENEGWEQRAIERRAQKLATDLAEQLFQERAEELIKRARDIVESGPPPCECNTKAQIPEGCHCGAKPSAISGASLTSNPPEQGEKESIKQVYWHQATKDVIQYRLQVEDVKKDKDEGLPERDINAMVVKPPKKGAGKNAGHGDGKKGKQGATNKGAVSPSSAVDSQQNDVKSTSPPSNWQTAIHDVMELRQQIENLKKESIKKQDLKLMEDNIAKLIYRASLQANTTSANSKVKRTTDDSNMNPKTKRLADANNYNEIAKSSKINKAINHPAYCDMNKITKRKTLDPPTPREMRPKLWENRRGSIRKPFKKNDAYSVNVCICNSKRQQQKELAEIIKMDPDFWLNKMSKDNVSLHSSTVRQTKPINSFLSEEVSAQTYMSKDISEPACPSNCVCFHKIPSNTSIDRLLEKLAKWKDNIDASFDLTSDIQISCCDICKRDVKCALTSDEILKVNSSLKSKIKSPMQSEKVLSNPPNPIPNEKKHAKATAPMITTDSEYMGAINLDKSNEDLCICHHETIKNTKSPYKCITSGKCSCARILKARKTEEPDKKDDKPKEIIVIKSKHKPRTKQTNELIIVDNNPKKEETTDLLEFVKEREPKEIPNKNNKDLPKKRALKSSDYQIEFLGVTLTDINTPATNPISLPSSTDDSNSPTLREVTEKDNNTSKHTRPLPEFYKLSKSSATNKTDTKDNFKLNCLSSQKTESPKVIVIDTLKPHEKTAKVITKTINTDIETNYNKDSRPTTGFAIKSPNPQVFPCECKNQLEDFKNFINATFAPHIVNEDAAIDVQSFKCFRNKEESCICCKKINDDDCKNLEDNAFHLLEEYLKKKFNEFKSLSCSSLCIPSEEEEKIFDVILKRVKRLISESTNQIACKCLAEEGKSQGSWNRAYGLLQEYLKMKIKKVQCSCLLAEDNKDSILPDVLDKISSLIEYDFDRLKNLCSCSNAPDNLENSNKNSKQVNFEAEDPLKEHNVMLLSLQSKFSESSQVNVCKNPSNKAPINLALEDELRMTQVMLNKTDETISTATLNKSENLSDSLPKDNILQKYNDQQRDSAFSLNRMPSEKSKDIDFERNSKESEVKIINDTSIRDIDESARTDSLINNVYTKKYHNIKIRNKSEPSHKITEALSIPENCVSTNTLPKKKLSRKHIPFFKEYKESIVINAEDNNESNNKILEKPCEHKPSIPYIGYTINCTCDSSLGAHICPKNVSNTDPGLIDKIYKTMMPDEAFYNKVSYMLPQLIKTKDLNKNSEHILKEVPGEETPVDVKLAVSDTTNCASQKIVLKHSKTDVSKSHIETNTLIDNESLISDCSGNDDALEWCDCSSQYNSGKQIDIAPLKRLIYFPAPIEDVDQQLKDNIPHENCVHIAANTKRKTVCDCEMVPICHVKMLIENIETKLVNAKCTCDSLTPNVCPVHSTMS